MSILAIRNSSPYVSPSKVLHHEGTNLNSNSVAALEGEILRLKSEVDQLRKTNQTLQRQLSEQHDECEEVHRKLISKETTLKASSKQLEDLQELHHERSQELEVSHRRARELQSSLSEVQAQRDGFLETLRQHELNSLTMRKEMKDKGDQLDQASHMASHLSQEQQQYQKQTQSLSQRITDLENENRNILKDREYYRKKFDHLRSKIMTESDVLRQAMESIAVCVPSSQTSTTRQTASAMDTTPSRGSPTRSPQRRSATRSPDADIVQSPGGAAEHLQKTSAAPRSYASWQYDWEALLQREDEPSISSSSLIFGGNVSGLSSADVDLSSNLDLALFHHLRVALSNLGYVILQMRKEKQSVESIVRGHMTQRQLNTTDLQASLEENSKLSSRVSAAEVQLSRAQTRVSQLTHEREELECSLRGHRNQLSHILACLQDWTVIESQVSSLMKDHAAYQEKITQQNEHIHKLKTQSEQQVVEFHDKLSAQTTFLKTDMETKMLQLRADASRDAYHQLQNSLDHSRMEQEIATAKVIEASREGQDLADLAVEKSEFASVTLGKYENALVYIRELEKNLREVRQELVMANQRITAFENENRALNGQISLQQRIEQKQTSSGSRTVSPARSAFLSNSHVQQGDSSQQQPYLSENRDRRMRQLIFLLVHVIFGLRDDQKLLCQQQRAITRAYLSAEHAIKTLSHDIHALLQHAVRGAKSREFLTRERDRGWGIALFRRAVIVVIAARRLRKLLRQPKTVHYGAMGGHVLSRRTHLPVVEPGVTPETLVHPSEYDLDACSVVNQLTEQLEPRQRLAELQKGFQPTLSHLLGDGLLRLRSVGIVLGDVVSQSKRILRSLSPLLSVFPGENESAVHLQSSGFMNSPARMAHSPYLPPPSSSSHKAAAGNQNPGNVIVSPPTPYAYESSSHLPSSPSRQQPPFEENWNAKPIYPTLVASSMPRSTSPNISISGNSPYRGGSTTPRGSNIKLQVPGSSVNNMSVLPPPSATNRSTRKDNFSPIYQVASPSRLSSPSPNSFTTNASSNQFNKEVLNVLRALDGQVATALRHTTSPAQ